MVKDWRHLDFTCAGFGPWNVMVLVEVISDSFTWNGLDEIPSEFVGVGDMKDMKERYFAWCHIAQEKNLV